MRKGKQRRRSIRAATPGAARASPGSLWAAPNTFKHFFWTLAVPKLSLFCPFLLQIAPDVLETLMVPWTQNKSMMPIGRYASELCAQGRGPGKARGRGFCMQSAQTFVSQEQTVSPQKAGWDSGKATGWEPSFPGEKCVPTEPCSREASFLPLGAWGKMEGFSTPISNLLMSRCKRSFLGGGRRVCVAGKGYWPHKR